GVVADRRQERRIGAEREGGERAALLEDGVVELDRDVLRVTGRAAVAHHDQAAPLAKAPRELANAGLECAGVLLEEARRELGALPRLADDRVPHGATGSVRGTGARPYWKYAAQAPSFETIVAPSGVRGVQVTPNAGHSQGFFTPRRIAPLMHAAG